MSSGPADGTERRMPIAVGIIGVGSMGMGLAYQSTVTPQISCSALADLDLDRAAVAARAIGREPIVVTTPGQMRDAIARGQLPVCEDGHLVATCESLDVLIESSSDVPAGGYFAEAALETGTHVVMMNAEADLMFGPYLMDLAQSRGVVYTTCDGDQPGVVAHLVDEIERWGFELVMAGNIKGFLDRDANPTSIVPEADKRGLSYKMCAGYTDGTKLAIEMALLANAFGLSTPVTGMLGPRATHVQDVLHLFDFAALRRQGPVVDYILGAEPNGGVFAVGYCDHPYQRKMLEMLKMGDGPFYVLYRPYHLCHVEAMKTVVDAAVHHRALLQPSSGFRTNVYAYAKRDLAPGDVLDGVGGYSCYGLIENCDDAMPPGLPICLADRVELQRPIARGERIALADVVHDVSRPDFALFAKAVAAARRLTCETA